MDITELSYEEAFGQLEGLVAQLETGELSLEQSVALYELGQRLSAHCQDLLEKAELKIRMVEEDDA
ncbi:MAG: exodeoxyribonuclease VII small subunit [Chloroflexi bacterium]|nr:exodeoxyribonuclease VII small subunit [Chloroflexota bacterium]